MEQKDNKYLFVGGTLFVLFVLQEVSGLKWPWLLSVQQDEVYRLWSGFVVFFVIAFQWILTGVRVWSTNPLLQLKFYNIHTWLGALSPLLFYLHSTQLGYAYLLIFSVLFFLNYLIGLINLDILKSKADWLFQGWMISHVSLSLTITLLSFYHIWVVFYYN